MKVIDLLRKLVLMPRTAEVLAEDDDDTFAIDEIELSKDQKVILVIKLVDEEKESSESSESSMSSSSSKSKPARPEYPYCAVCFQGLEEVGETAWYWCPWCGTLHDTMFVARVAKVTEGTVFLSRLAANAKRADSKPIEFR